MAKRPKAETTNPEASVVATPEPSIDLDRLFKLRLVIARHGEMDRAQWWNTKSMLGRQGGMLLGRGFPRTHRFARARVVFAVARARCKEIFDPPGYITLWNLPAALEDQFDARWHIWLDEAESWQGFFDELQQLPESDLLATLAHVDLISDEQARSVSRLRRSNEGNAVPLPGTRALDDETMTLLAAAFARGEVGKPAVPHVRFEP